MAPKFNLQPILDYRHSRVEMLEVELSRLLSDQQRGKEFLAALQQMQGQLYDQLGECQQGDLDLVKIAQVRSNIQLVGQTIEQQQARLLELDRRVASKQAEVVEARQGEEMLVTLKKKALEQCQAEQAIRESRLQDDIYIAQAYRRAVKT
jgi:flagellar export protein FliJ